MKFCLDSQKTDPPSFSGYVVENDGKLGVLGFGLTGSEDETGTSSSGTGGYSGYARSLSDSPMMQGLTNMVYEAISKYE